MEDHGVARLADGVLDGPDDPGKKGVAHAADHQADGVRLGAYQIPGAVVGHIVELLHRLHDPGADGVADVGMVVEHTGDSADGNAAVFGDILDGHRSALLPPEV